MPIEINENGKRMAKLHDLHPGVDILHTHGWSMGRCLGGDAKMLHAHLSLTFF